MLAAAPDGGLEGAAVESSPVDAAFAAADAGTASAPASASDGALVVEVRPAEVTPGAVVLLDLFGNAAGARARVDGRTFEFFRSGPAWLRAFVALSVDVLPGDLTVVVSVDREADGAVQLGAEVRVLATQLPETELTVARRFVHAPRSARARMRADKTAFRKAYGVPFGPPRFTHAFLNPREGAELNAPFGQRRVFNGELQSHHQGLDLDGRVGDPVAASNDGQVRLARDCYISGNSVVLDHGAGLFTTYFHLSRLLARAGRQVRRGDLVGLVGGTGRVTGPHLHFGLRVGGRLADPATMLGLDLWPWALPNAESELPSWPLTVGRGSPPSLVPAP